MVERAVGTTCKRRTTCQHQARPTAPSCVCMYCTPPACTARFETVHDDLLLVYAPPPSPSHRAGPTFVYSLLLVPTCDEDTPKMTHDPEPTKQTRVSSKFHTAPLAVFSGNNRAARSMHTGPGDYHLGGRCPRGGERPSPQEWVSYCGGHARARAVLDGEGGVAAGYGANDILGFGGLSHGPRIPGACGCGVWYHAHFWAVSIL